MPFTFDTFLQQLVAAIAAATGLAYASAPFALYRHVDPGDAANSTDPYSVLRVYAGDQAATTPEHTLSIQCMTNGSSSAAAWTRAQLIRNTLLDTAGLPRRMWTLTTYRILGVTLRPLMEVGPDANRRSLIVFNFDVDAVLLPAA